MDEKKVPPEPRPIPRDALPQEIKADWDRYTQLAKLTPSPEVVAPYQWKQYTAQLLRLEEMLYAGAEEKDVSSWRNAMTKLAGEIREQCKPFSAGNNPMLLDRVAPDARTREQDKTLAEATTGLNLLWKSDNPEKLTEDVQIWKKLITSIQDNPEMRRQVLVHGWRWTMEKLAQEPDLLATERVLSVLEETIPPSHRPADVQFVRLLVRDTQEKPWSLVRNQPELIKLAVSTRTRAERMAWMGSDAVAGNVTVHWVQVQRCLAKLLETADAMRLEAEDLLFDAHASSWEKSRELFLQANEKYTQAAEQAQELISACELRDQLYYQLPFIHDWAASQPAAFPDRVMEAWSALHQLSQMLLETPLDHQLLRTRSDSLRKLATELHVYIHRALENEERSSTSATAEPYLNLKRILAMPAFSEAIPGNSVDERWNIAIKRRLELLGRLRTISSKLYENTEQPENVQESRILYQPDAHADTRLRLSYARMGNDTLEFIQNAGVTNLKLSWNVERQVAPQKQFESIRLISSKLGILWSFLPQALTQSEPAQKAFELLHATATAATLPTAEQWILQAAQLTRQLDPGTSEPRHKYNQLNSMQIARSYFTYRFLLSQAMRSQAEGWAELQPGERDYSLKVAQLHIDAAKEILDALAKEKSVEHRDRGWHAQFVEDRKKLERPL
ncbi:MAG TPA: hypothetical protein PKA06_09850, partial [Gemmatales bacterium]|nr:hypothetical protein [Gemmatales bacterium]